MKNSLRIRVLAVLICLSTLLCQQVYANEPVVNTKEVYTFHSMEEDVKRLQREYPHLLQVKTIGETPAGRSIWAIKLGNGEKSILINAAHHGREWITSLLVMKMVEDYAKSHKQHKPYEGYNMSILDEVSIWFIPMVNPDGVTIQQEGFLALPPKQQWNMMVMNGGSIDFSRWKANGEGIDLNRQYPAGWEELDGDAPFPFYQLYKGEKPLQANEVKSLVDFTKEINPIIALSYHSSGREIFWYYQTPIEHVTRDWRIAKSVSTLTEYKLAKPVNTAVGGGFTDWFIHSFHRPALTLEVSFFVNETSPPLSVFQEEWKRNRAVGLHLAHEAKKSE